MTGSVSEAAAENADLGKALRRGRKASTADLQAMEHWKRNGFVSGYPADTHEVQDEEDDEE